MRRRRLLPPACCWRAATGSCASSPPAGWERSTRPRTWRSAAAIALKTIRPELVARGQALERFRREILLARRVTHPNVCRIFDLGHDPSADAGPDVAFLTMELLRGETLRQHLRRGPLSAEEAFPLVAQMAAGLAAAHDAGVVHRDFKAANVMLVPPLSGDAEPRAVVTDFGLRLVGGRQPGIDHPLGPPGRDTRLRGPRAGRGTRGHIGRRHLCLRCRPLRDGDRAIALRGRLAALHRAQAPPRRARLAAGPRARSRTGMGSRDLAMPPARARENASRRPPTW